MPFVSSDRLRANATVTSDDPELLASFAGPVVERVEAPGPACDLAVVSDSFTSPLMLSGLSGRV